MATQRSLFPVTLQFATQDAVMLQDLLGELHLLGYHIEPFGKDAFVVQGTPADVEQGNEKVAIESLLEQYKHFSSDVRYSKREKLVRAMAWQQSIKPGKTLGQKEIESLLQDLFSCSQPNITAGGNPTYIEFKIEYLEKLFGKG